MTVAPAIDISSFARVIPFDADKRVLHAVIEVYSTPTANGQKVHIALAETGFAYRARLLDLTAGDHRQPDFLAINPLGKLPAIVDLDGPEGAPLALGETGAIVLYLCRKAGRFLPKTARQQAALDYWAFAVNASLAMPLAMQFYHSTLAPEKCDWAIAAMTEGAMRALGAFEAHLHTTDYLVGDQFGAADMLLYPHLATSAQRLPEKLQAFPALRAYVARIGARPGVQAGMAATVT
jgi:GST-like protein